MNRGTLASGFFFVKNLKHFGWMVKFGQKFCMKIEPERLSDPWGSTSPQGSNRLPVLHIEAGKDSSTSAPVPAHQAVGRRLPPSTRPWSEVLFLTCCALCRRRPLTFNFPSRSLTGCRRAPSTGRAPKSSPKSKNSRRPGFSTPPGGHNIQTADLFN